MKILHTADWHLGKRLESYSRLEEQKEVLAEICQIADEQQVDIILIAGDLFDTFNPSIEAVDLFYKTLKKLSKNGQRPVIAIAGNHDSPERIEAPDPLARECGIFFAGFSDTKISDAELESGVSVKGIEPGLVEIKLPQYNYPLRLLLTPYANEQRLRTCFDTDKEVELRNLLANHWKNLAEQYCDNTGVNMLMAHLFFAEEGKPQEKEPEDERSVLQVGGAQAIFTSCIPTQIQYTALGHLHRYIRMGNKEKPVVYSSSPLAYSFAEADQDKFVVVIEAEPNKSVEISKTKLASGKRLLRKRFEDIETCVGWLGENPNTLLELTIVTDTFLTGLERKQIYESHDGIVTIIPEVRSMNQHESTVEQIDPKGDIRPLFQSYFVSKLGQEPNQEMLDLFEEILAKK
jgi:exonuclease SbcD